MLAHGIARCAGIGKPDRFGAAAAARRSHNLLICPPSPAAYLYAVGVPLAPQQRFAGSPRPAKSPPTHLGGALLSSLAGATPRPRSGVIELMWLPSGGGS